MRYDSYKIQEIHRKYGNTWIKTMRANKVCTSDHSQQNTLKYTSGSEAGNIAWLPSLMLCWSMDYLTVYDSGPPSCLTSVWPVPWQPWSCCHDVSPRRDGEGAPEPDQRLGCSRLLPHPAECPSPIEPTAVETEPATHSLPWLLVGCTSPHQSYCLTHR